MGERWIALGEVDRGGLRWCGQEVWRASRGVALEVGVGLALPEDAVDGGYEGSPFSGEPVPLAPAPEGGPLRFPPVTPLWPDTANKHSLKAFTRRPHFVWAPHQSDPGKTISAKGTAPMLAAKTTNRRVQQEVLPFSRLCQREVCRSLLPAPARGSAKHLLNPS